MSVIQMVENTFSLKHVVRVSASDLQRLRVHDLWVLVSVTNTSVSFWHQASLQQKEFHKPGPAALSSLMLWPPRSEHEHSHVFQYIWLWLYSHLPLPDGDVERATAELASLRLTPPLQVRLEASMWRQFKSLYVLSTGVFARHGGGDWFESPVLRENSPVSVNLGEHFRHMVDQNVFS